MPVCAQCGTENPDIAKFCLACGSPLAAAPPPQEFRKIVTIVFSDLKGSTAMGEKLDSESLREVMTRYFDAMSAELERHGGVVEKFIGDAIMAVFGLPKLHEDDALARGSRGGRHAARAGGAERRARAPLGRAAHGSNRREHRRGRRGRPDMRASGSSPGDAVNVAARLEQAAGAQEVLLGDLTYRLVRDYVDVEEVEPLELKGKSEPVPAYRLVGVHGERRAATATRLADGRARPRARAAARARSNERSTSDLSARHGRRRGRGRQVAPDRRVRALGRGPTRTVLRGRCLPYGDGITFWPLAEAVRQAAGIVERDTIEAAKAKLAALAADGTS